MIDKRALQRRRLRKYADIIARYKNGETAKQIADSMSVSRQRVGQVLALAVAAAVKEEDARICDLAIAQCDETEKACSHDLENLVIYGARKQAEKLGVAIRASIKEGK